MTTFIIYYLIITLILRIFFKPDMSMLYCGLAGFSGLKGLTEVQELKITQNLKILALYNQSRGEDGCGIFINGQVYKGYEDSIAKTNTKKFRDFLGNNNFLMPKYTSNLGTATLLHARKSTHGANTLQNTHPFLIESIHGEKDNIYLCHNGTLDNIWEMCRENGLKSIDYHVDSHALGALIDKIGVEKALLGYKGSAALLWIKLSQPDSLYLYHGASRKIKNDTIWEERPLYSLKTAEGVYFSSMEESLLAIRDVDTQKVYDVDFNTVFKITNGKFTTYKKIIAREDSNLYVYPVHKPVNNNFKDWQNEITNTSNTIGYPTNYNNTNRSDELIKKSTEAPATSLVWGETIPQKSGNDVRIVFFKNRYFLGNLLVHGEHFLNSKGIIDEKETPEANVYYFYAGIMLKNKEAFDEIIKLAKDGLSWVNLNGNFAYCISKYTMHPVTNLETEFIDKTNSNNYWRYGFYENGHRCVKNFSVKFSSRTYMINKKGFLDSIVSSDKEDKEFFVSSCKTKVNSEVLSVFDKSYNGIAALFNDVSLLERKAILEFCEEQLKANSALDPTSKEVEEYYLTICRNSVHNKTSIRIELGDLTCTLETYVEMLREADSVDEVSDILDEEAFYQMHGYMPSNANFIHDSMVHPNRTIEDNFQDEEFNEDNIQLEIIMEKLETLVDQLAMLDETAEELTTVDNDLSQEVSSLIYKALDSLKHNLSEVLIKNELTNIADALNRKVKGVI